MKVDSSKQVGELRSVWDIKGSNCLQFVIDQFGQTNNCKRSFSSRHDEEEKVEEEECSV